MNDKSSRLIILSAFYQSIITMDSLTLLRFAFACNMSKNVIIATDPKLSTGEKCEPLYSVVFCRIAKKSFFTLHS